MGIENQDELSDDSESDEFDLADLDVQRNFSIKVLKKSKTSGKTALARPGKAKRAKTLAGMAGMTGVKKALKMKKFIATKMKRRRRGVGLSVFQKIMSSVYSDTGR